MRSLPRGGIFLTIDKVLVPQTAVAWVEVKNSTSSIWDVVAHLSDGSTHILHRGPDQIDCVYFIKHEMGWLA